MLKKSLSLTVALTALVALAVPAPASGQVARTWVSQDGSDANDCSYSSPCSTFARAVDPLIEGGEINAKTDGNFGEFSITQGMTVDGRGHSVGITAFGAGITINAPGDKVTIRNLHIQGFPGAGNGITVQAVGHLHLRDMTIRTMDGRGVDFRNADVPSRLTVTNSAITEGEGNGIVVAPGTTGPAGAHKRVVVRNSEISSNAGSGIAVVPSSPPSTNPVMVGVFDSTIADNVMHGLSAEGAQARMRLAQNVITGNVLNGLRMVSGGQIHSYGNNRIYGNGIDGAPTSVIPQN